VRSATSPSVRSALLAGLAAVLLAAAARAGLPLEAGWADHTYPDAAGVNGQPSGEMAESKLWWNDGSWWGSLWSDAAGAYTIQRLDAASQSWVDTGVAIDDRLETRADTLFDAGRLYVLSHWFHDPGAPAAPGQRARLYRYAYEPATDSHTLDPGFPVEVNAAWSETAVLARDSGGTLWAAWVESQQVMLNRSVGGDDAQWGTPFGLPTPHAANLTSDDLVSIAAYDGRVGCLWSNETELAFYFAAHRDGDPDGSWSEAEVYGLSTDDHVNLKALAGDPAGRLFAAVKTSQAADLILLLACRSTAGFCTGPGDWEAHTVWGANPAGMSPTRPILEIDTANREIYVFTRSIESDASGEETRAIYYKRADLDAIAFPDPAGLGTPLVLETGGRMNDPSGTKGPVDATTGLLVLASDRVADRYFHGFASLGGPAPSTHTLTLATSGSGTATATPAPGPYPHGAAVTLSAAPAAGSAFVSWSGSVAGSANPTTFTILADAAVTANFAPLPASQPTLTVTSMGSGQVELSPPGGVYDPGTLVTLTATPAPGWLFDRFEGDLSGPASPQSIVVDGDRSVSAVFEQPVEEPRLEQVALGEAVSARRVATASALTASRGDLYLAAVSIRSPGTVVGMQGLGLGWSLVRRQCSGRSATGVELWRAQGTPTASGPVTADLSTAVSAAVLAVARYAGARDQDPLGALASANSNGISGGCSGGTDSAAYSYPLASGGRDRAIFAATALRNRSHVPGAGWTERAELAAGSSGSVAGLAAMDRATSGAGTVTVAGSLSGSTDWASLAVEIRGARLPECSDGLDNDGDGGIDHDGAGLGAADPHCLGQPERDSESGSLSLFCGLGFELALLLPALAWLRGGPWRRRSLSF
jgi:hypothetical protein